MNDINYEFKNFPQYKQRVLLCPDCGENLSRYDINFFSSCPYCQFVLPINDDIEDYLLDPVIENWIRLEENQLSIPSESNVGIDNPDIEIFDL